MNIHDNLKQLRLASGLTQEQVAEQLHLTRQSVSGYESGRTRPDLETLLRLAEIYGTDLDGIIYGQQPQLQARQRLQKAARWLWLIIAVLTLLSSLFLCSGNHFFMTGGGALVAENPAVWAAHQKLMRAWTLTDALILNLAACGFILLLFLQFHGKCRITTADALHYALLFSLSLPLIAAAVSLFDARFSTIDYLITPLQVVARFWLFFFISMLLDRRQK